MTHPPKRGRPYSEGPRKTAKINLLISEERKQALQEAARAEGVSMTTLIERWIDSLKGKA